MSPAQQHSVKSLLRFGVFEFDLTASELRRNGVKVRLQEQPCQILTMLLERPGEIVGREEIRKRLWSSDTFVDFDHSLNSAVNKLREALGDSAASPRYVETLARRGYRFLAPVERIDLNAPDPGFLAKPAAPPKASDPNLLVAASNRSLTRGLFALIQLMYLIFYVEALFHLDGVERVADTLTGAHLAVLVEIVVIITAGIGIPLRCYLLSAVGFDLQGLGQKLRQLFPFLLALDGIWAVAPFLVATQIGFGAAFAATCALLYVPFSERTLVRMAYADIEK
jgi:cholera toxin transcriptional activator